MIGTRVFPYIEAFPKKSLKKCVDNQVTNGDVFLIKIYVKMQRTKYRTLTSTVNLSKKKKT